MKWLCLRNVILTVVQSTSIYIYIYVWVGGCVYLKGHIEIYFFKPISVKIRIIFIGALYFEEIQKDAPGTYRLTL